MSEANPGSQAPKPAGASDTPAPASDTISIDEFSRVKMRVGRVVEATDHPSADKLLILKVDLGDEQRQIVAGLKGHYAPAQLVGRNIVIVTNLAPRTMRAQQSQGMLLAASTPDHARVIVLTTESDIPPGSRIS